MYIYIYIYTCIGIYAVVCYYEHQIATNNRSNITSNSTTTTTSDNNNNNNSYSEARLHLQRLSCY